MAVFSMRIRDRPYESTDITLGEAKWLKSVSPNFPVTSLVINSWQAVYNLIDFPNLASLTVICDVVDEFSLQKIDGGAITCLKSLSLCASTIFWQDVINFLILFTGKYKSIKLASIMSNELLIFDAVKDSLVLQGFSDTMFRFLLKKFTDLKSLVLNECSEEVLRSGKALPGMSDAEFGDIFEIIKQNNCNTLATLEFQAIRYPKNIDPTYLRKFPQLQRLSVANGQKFVCVVATGECCLSDGSNGMPFLLLSYFERVIRDFPPQTMIKLCLTACHVASVDMQHVIQRHSQSLQHVELRHNSNHHSTTLKNIIFSVQHLQCLIVDGGYALGIYDLLAALLTSAPCRGTLRTLELNVTIGDIECPELPLRQLCVSCPLLKRLVLPWMSGPNIYEAAGSYSMGLLNYLRVSRLYCCDSAVSTRTVTAFASDVRDQGFISAFPLDELVIQCDNAAASFPSFLASFVQSREEPLRLHLKATEKTKWPTLYRDFLDFSQQDCAINITSLVLDTYFAPTKDAVLTIVEKWQHLRVLDIKKRLYVAMGEKVTLYADTDPKNTQSAMSLFYALMKECPERVCFKKLVIETQQCLTDSKLIAVLRENEKYMHLTELSLTAGNASIDILEFLSHWKHQLRCLHVQVFDHEAPKKELLRTIIIEGSALREVRIESPQYVYKDFSDCKRRSMKLIVAQSTA